MVEARFGFLEERCLQGLERPCIPWTALPYEIFEGIAVVVVVHIWRRRCRGSDFGPIVDGILADDSSDGWARSRSIGFCQCQRSGDGPSQVASINQYGPLKSSLPLCGAPSISLAGRQAYLSLSIAI